MNTRNTIIPHRTKKESEWQSISGVPQKTKVNHFHEFGFEVRVQFPHHLNPHPNNWALVRTTFILDSLLLVLTRGEDGAFPTVSIWTYLCLNIGLFHPIQGILNFLQVSRDQRECDVDLAHVKQPPLLAIRCLDVGDFSISLSPVARQTNINAMGNSQVQILPNIFSFCSKFHEA